jgi:hypothetical protein
MTRFAFILCLLTAAPVCAQGDFALQPGDCNPKRAISVADLSRPAIDGLTIRFPPSCNDKYVADSVARARQAKKPYTLLLMSGDAQNPATEANVRRVESLIYTLGRKYSTDPLCWGVHGTITPYRGASEELHWKAMPAAAIEANKRIIFAWSRAFPNQVKLLAIAGGDRAAMEKLIDYGIKVAPGRFLVKTNSLKANTDLSATHNQLVVYAGKRGALVGWEMVGSTLESRFGGTLQQAIDKARVLAKQAGQPISYLAIYPSDLSKIGAIK